MSCSAQMSQWMSLSGWGRMGGMMFFGGIIWIVVLVLAIVAVMWIAGQRSRAGRAVAIESKRSGLDILEERYAKGEIQRDEYLEKKRDLGG